MRACVLLLLGACGGAPARPEVPAGDPEGEARPTHHVTSLGYSPEGATLAAGSTLGTVTLWEAASGSVRAALGPHEGAVNALAWSPDATSLAAASSGSVTIWDARSGVERAALPGTEVLSLAYSPDGSRLATGGRDEVVRIWDPQTAAAIGELAPTGSPAGGRLSSPLVASMNVVRSLCFSPDAATLALASRRFVHLRDSRSGERRATLEGHTSRVEAVAWSLDGRRIVSAALDASIRIWDATTGSPLRSLRSPAPATSVAWSPDGAALVSGADDGTATIWDASTGAPRHVLHADRHGVTSVAWSPDGSVVAAAGYDLAVTIWDAATGARRATLPLGGTSARGVAEDLVRQPPVDLAMARHRDELAGARIPKDRVRSALTNHLGTTVTQSTEKLRPLHAPRSVISTATLRVKGGRSPSSS